MQSITKGLLAIPLFVFACFSQTPARLEFDAASLKPEPPIDGSRPIAIGCRGGPGTKDPGLFICENMSLSNLMHYAYLLGTDQLSAPDWTNSALFDLTARVPPGTTYEQFQIMLQNLLADRFQLAVHHETRQHLSYKLVVAKNGPKFKEAGAPAEQDDDAPPRPSGSKPFEFDADGYPVFGPGDSGTKMSGSRGRMYEPQMTMDRLAGFLAGNLHATITDATGLGGRYEISLAWVVGSRTAAPPSSGEEASLAETDSGPTLTQALQSQLGLRLVESSKVPIDLLVVDHAEKVPAGN